ncbi:NAD-dependent epimerase/dehydratase family protein [Pseudomonas sp. BNK-43-a]|uniref:NAD-dependent epimerase/dehydratase family protein n=1 Tax=unclassified Pseudomonas TaxID=196821 RepID=UPI0039BFE931
MKILILGANGFIGAPLLKRVLSEGHEARVLTRKETGSYPAGVEVFHGDLLDEALNTDALIADCDVIFNCAGEIRNEALMSALHVESTRRLLGAVKRRLADDPEHRCHWVQLSSVGAYGPSLGRARVVTEDTQPNPVGMYEVTKTQADELVQEAGQIAGLTYAILRPSNVYGPRMPNNSLRQLAALIRRRIFFYVGFKRPVATYIHVEDVVSGLMLCGFNPKSHGQIYNLSNDCFMDEMVDGLARAMNTSRPFLKLPETFVRSLVYVASKLVKLPVTQERVDALMVRTRYPSKKLESQLGFVAKYPVPETIGDILI